jgi:hypothetical protein
MAQEPLSPQQLRRHLKPRPALKEPGVQVTFEPPVHPLKAGTRVFPAVVKGTFVKRLVRSRRQAAIAEIDENKLQGFLPEHLALNPQKPLLDKRFKRGKASTWRRLSFLPTSGSCFRIPRSHGAPPAESM